jgi:hypothetical protein
VSAFYSAQSYRCRFWRPQLCCLFWESDGVRVAVNVYRFTNVTDSKLVADAKESPDVVDELGSGRLLEPKTNPSRLASRVSGRVSLIRSRTADLTGCATTKLSSGRRCLSVVFRRYTSRKLT